MSHRDFPPATAGVRALIIFLVTLSAAISLTCAVLLALLLVDVLHWMFG